jgi:hypothetical protein
MSIRKLAVLAAIAAFGVLALGAGPASATTVLRLDPGNTVWSGVTKITNTTSDTAVLSTSLGAVTCASTKFTADLTSHHSATSITGHLTTLTFSSCTDHIAAVNIQECGLHAGSPLPTVHITATSATANTIVVNNAVVRCSIQNSTSGCDGERHG